MSRIAHGLTGTVLVAAVLVGGTRPAEACSCMGGVPVCESFWRTPAVFRALVLDITPTPTEPRQFLQDRRVLLQVEEAWRGGVSGVIEVRTGTGGGDCGYDFVRGERYLVYADNRGGSLFVSICGRTKRLAEAAEDLRYVKTAFQPAALGRIFGSVNYQRQNDEANRPIAGYTVTLRGPEREWKTTTSADGNYEFRVPAGKYRIEVGVPATEHAYGQRDIELMDPRGCAKADYSVVADGRISTRVVDADGNPVKGVRVEFIKRASITPERPFADARPVTTGANGYAEAPQLQPDEYVVGINVNFQPEPGHPYPRLFYPGVTDLAEAQVIDLSRGERVELGPFVLPPRLQERRITGIIRWPDGTPAAGASVILFTARGDRRRGLPIGSSVNTDQEGRFVLAALAGRRYHLGAFIDVKTADAARVQWFADSEDFDSDKIEAPFTLMLAPPRKEQGTRNKGQGTRDKDLFPLSLVPCPSSLV